MKTFSIRVEYTGLVYQPLCVMSELFNHFDETSQGSTGSSTSFGVTYHRSVHKAGLMAERTNCIGLLVFFSEILNRNQTRE